MKTKGISDLWFVFCVCLRSMFVTCGHGRHKDWTNCFCKQRTGWRCRMAIDSAAANLVRCLFDLANKICSPSTLEAEQKFLKNVLRQNGYPDPFIERNMGEKETPTMMYTDERKPIYICLPFKGEVASERVNRRLSRAIRSTFTSATLKSWFTTWALFSLNLKDKVPSHDKSMVIYSFSCCCVVDYIGRISDCLEI